MTYFAFVSVKTCRCKCSSSLGWGIQ